MKNYEVGQKLMWVVNDFDCHKKIACKVTEVHEDYAIATTEDGTTLWIDEDTEEDFEEGRCQL